MRNEGDDSAASDTILEAVVDVSLSRIFEMGTECEHGVLVRRAYSSCLRPEYGVFHIHVFRRRRIGNRPAPIVQANFISCRDTRRQAARNR